MEKKQIKLSLYQFLILVFFILLIIAGMVLYFLKYKNINTSEPVSNPILGKVDDWQYTPQDDDYDNYSTTTFGGVSLSTDSTFAATEKSSGNIGFSTGGAKDVNNFRENIENGYFPISTDITYNGLFYDYTFDTGSKIESNELFSPSYSCAISKDPISSNQEYYMTVGLNSNIKESDFSRKKLNLVVVLDISGSMSSSFNSYYYDSFVKNETKTAEDYNKSKMQIANEAVNVLIDRLNEDDRYGMVLFDDSAYLAKPLNLVAQTDMDAIKNHVLEINAMGGTNFEAGYTEGTKLFEEYLNNNKDEYENRIIVITDAMPNYGDTSDTGLLKYMEDNSKNGIYTTFIGVGVDFNTKLIEKISDVKGANYYSVHNSKEFKERMGDQFEYMVTPLVFDLNLDLDSPDFEIAAVYGSDTASKENGNIMNVNTLFPSKTTSSGEVKGGVVLLKLNKTSNSESGKINLKVSYKDRNGKSYSNSQTVDFYDREDYFENTGIRKAIVLTRYANAIKNWILYERTEDEKFIITPVYGITDCIYTPEEVTNILGENERTSVDLTVSEKYKEVFKTLKAYIQSENEAIKDDTLNQEIKILDVLIEK